EIQRIGEKYKIKFQSDSSVYDINVRQNTGDVTNLTQRSKKSQEKTESEIREIVANEEAGEIQSIEKKEEQDQSYYYVTAIKGDTEATYKLQTTTGKIVDVVERKKVAENPPEPSKQEPETPKTPT